MADMIYVCNVDEEGRFGGPERRIVQIASRLRSYDVQTHVLYPKLDSNRFSKELQKAGVSCSSIDITRLSRERRILLSYLFGFFSEIKRLRKFFVDNSFDLVHVNGSYQFKVAIAAKLAHVPVVWHLNDTHVPSLLKKVFGFVSGYCANGFIVAGTRVYDYYLSKLNVKELPCAEIHAPIDVSIFNPDNIIENDSDRSTDKVLIGTVSGVNPAKGLEYYIEMAAKLLAERKDVEFVIAGAILSSQKGYHDMLKQKMRDLGLRYDDIEFVGLVDDVPSFLSKLDICVFTSVTEASPTSIWEAMAMAKPIVTTDVGSVNQHIENGRSGFVVAIKDVNNLFSKVNQLVDNEKLRNELGCEARMVASRELDVESAAFKHNYIYRKVIATPELN